MQNGSVWLRFALTNGGTTDVSGSIGAGVLLGDINNDMQDKDTGIVYATYSLGPSIAFEQPQAEIDRANQLHVLHCAAPRAWSYSRIGLNGELLTHSSFMETKTRPRLVHSANGEVAVRGGVAETPTQSSRSTAPKLSARPPGLPKHDQ